MFKTFKTFKKSHSDFWLRDSDRLYSDTGDDFVKALRLSKHKRAISNFVNILTGENYPVYFKGEKSYTDGKMIVIGSDLKNNNHDETVGLALHEASHLKLSDFSLLSEINKKIPKDLYTKAEKLGYDNKNLQKFVSSVTNIIEDRRIDNYIYKSAPGYREYYKALYNKYFYSDIITKGLMSSEARDETFGSYLFRLCNLINPASSLTALKGLKEIDKVINIKNISRLENSGDAFKIALKITKIVIDNVEQNSGKGGDGDAKKGKGKIDPDAEVILDSNSPSGDSEGDTIDFDDLSDKQKDSLKKQMEKINKFLDGDDSDKKELTKGEKSSLRDVNNSNASVEQVGEDTQGSGSIKKVDCIVYKAMNKALIDSKSFVLSNSCKISEEAVSKGIRIGKALGKKLQIRNEVRNTQYNRQSRGKVDSRMIAAAGFGYENIFEQNHQEAYKGATIHISIDASGSMSGYKFDQAITNAVAIAKASDVIGNMDVSISFRSTQNSAERTGHGLPMIVMAYDSKKDKFSKISELFPYLGTSGTTPEGLCFEAIMDMLQESGKDLDSYFINLSDGSPWYETEDFVYGNTNGARHTRLQVKKMEAKGIKILSYFVGSSTYENQTFINSYGKNNSSFINVENINDIAKTINKLMLKK